MQINQAHIISGLTTARTAVLFYGYQTLFSPLLHTQKTEVVWLYARLHRVRNLTFGLLHLIASQIQGIVDDLFTWPSQMVGHLSFCLVNPHPWDIVWSSLIVGPTINRCIIFVGSTIGINRAGHCLSQAALYTWLPLELECDLFNTFSGVSSTRRNCSNLLEATLLLIRDITALIIHCRHREALSSTSSRISQ